MAQDYIFIPDQRGTFSINTWGTITLRVYDQNGRPANADSITVTLTEDLTNKVIFSESPEKVYTGFYIHDWFVATDIPTGDYTAVWSYSIGGGFGVQSVPIVVSADAVSIAQHTMALTSLRIGLEYLIGGVQNIPLRFEQARPSRDNTIYFFTFGRWNQPVSVNVYRNQKMLTGGYEVDYLNGKIIFDNANLDADQIHVDYNFRWFEDNAMDHALFMGLQQVNVYAPQTYWSFSSVQDKFIQTTLFGAAIILLRSFLFELGFPQNRALFGPKEDLDSWRSSINELIKDYAEQQKNALEQKKNFPYVGLTRSIIQPTHTIPGGRARFFRMMFGNGV